ncbi:MAG: hypothetical protein JSW59_17130 [Phycisphaerales bacterium]|nr:MAG: hypothetical protein JSW59_17130 [Phycisphaerales bacterium]
MKRISISTVVLLAIAVGVAEARPVYGGWGFGYNCNRYRTRWSIYAHGLISGDVYYSPYAPGHGGSRLVDGHVRYSPYAFGGGHCGLVADYWGSYGYGFAPAHFHVLGRTVPARSCFQSTGSYGHGDQSRALKKHTETAEERKARRAALAKAREKSRAIRANDGKVIIAEYLKGNNIAFRTTRILSIEGRTVSVDFVLNDGKTIIKYWNPAEIPSKNKQQQRKRKFFEKYVQSWKVVRDEHLQAGGNLHQITSSDRDEILAKLPQCRDLNGIEKVYASAQSKPAPAEMP